jgi:hypothetical protein
LALLNKGLAEVFADGTQSSLVDKWLR